MRDLAAAQSNLGLMYADGQGVAQNYAEAVRWCRLAADQGNAAAQSNLGRQARSNHNVARNRGEERGGDSDPSAYAKSRPFRLQCGFNAEPAWAVRL